jgi:hypothetical protein
MNKIEGIYDLILWQFKTATKMNGKNTELQPDTLSVGCWVDENHQGHLFMYDVRMTNHDMACTMIRKIYESFTTKAGDHSSFWEETIEQFQKDTGLDFVILISGICYLNNYKIDVSDYVGAITPMLIKR